MSHLLEEQPTGWDTAMTEIWIYHDYTMINIDTREFFSDRDIIGSAQREGHPVPTLVRRWSGTGMVATRLILENSKVIRNIDNLRASWVHEAQRSLTEKIEHAHIYHPRNLEAHVRVQSNETLMKLTEEQIEAITDNWYARDHHQ